TPANAFSISGTGRLDLTNNSLLAPVPGSTIKGYLNTAYTANQDWSGNAGLTSSLAKTNPVKYSVGYAYGNDQSAIDTGLNVPAGKSLAHGVLTGDANLDGKVNFLDITQLLGYKYNTKQQASYTDGDLNYDGVVNFLDITTLLSANYNTGETFPAAGAVPAAKAVPTLTGTK